MRLHHVQVACPPGGEDVARRFYAGGLGLGEVDKPADMVSRGGAWFRAAGSDGEVSLEIHIGVEDPFTPARKAHPAIVLDDVVAYEALAERLAGLGYEVDRSQQDTFPGYLRFHTHDGHDNRVEVLCAAPH